jgi:tetratricopeptide (TPR) repeat protein
LYISALGAQGVRPDADALYRNRANLADARRAAEIWREAISVSPTSFEAAWKLARAHYWLGNHAPEGERKAFLERGIEAGRQAAALEPQKPEGHFWVAANMGALAESFGLRAGLKYRKPIRDELETVRRLDPGFMNGSADRALGRWYFKVPALFGGSRDRAVQHLRTSLTYDPNSTVSLFFLAEVMADTGKKAEARSLLQRVLEVQSSPEWEPEDNEYKTKARTLLARLK